MSGDSCTCDYDAPYVYEACMTASRKIDGTLVSGSLTRCVNCSFDVHDCSVLARFPASDGSVGGGAAGHRHREYLLAWSARRSRPCVNIMRTGCIEILAGVLGVTRLCLPRSVRGWRASSAGVRRLSTNSLPVSNQQTSCADGARRERRVERLNHGVKPTAG